MTLVLAAKLGLSIGMSQTTQQEQGAAAAKPGVNKAWQRIMWEVGAGLIIGAGWAVWVLYQVSPRSVVTELVLQSQAKRSQAATGPQAPAGTQAQQPAAPALPATKEH
jgi:hypothetical protein